MKAGLQPRLQLRQAVLEADLGPPSNCRRQGTDIRHVPGLVTGPPIRKLMLQVMACQPRDEADKFEQADRIDGATAQVEDAPTCLVDVTQDSDPGLDGVRNKQRIANLVPISVDRERLTAEC